MLEFISLQLDQAVAMATKQREDSPVITDLQIQSIAFLHSLAVPEMKSAFSTDAIVQMTKNLSKLFHTICFKVSILLLSFSVLLSWSILIYL